ncbi:cytochrome P450 [Trametes coccinea BRFM310]|uniref:Cytochrome P450 n=1 Tax=Trametes coccinea (strain BRFM310) TaxID=1353009 RepID=A0A1Y2J1W6_TRAC3|nr:cytochrome P450 [Trametes coccinea BRFM310]
MGLSVLFASLICPLALFASLPILFVIWSFVRGRNRTRRQRLPPGPKPLPIVGNIFDLMHMENQWTCFKDLCTRYGDLVYFNILGQDVVIIGNHRLVNELLEKRSANTSDRPHSYVLPLTMRYGQWWRNHRRAFWQILHPKVVQGYREIQQGYTRRFLHKLIETPNHMKEHSRYVFGAAMLKILYNIHAKDGGDEALARIDKAVTCTADTLTGGHPIQFLPWLRHVPVHGIYRTKAAPFHAHYPSCSQGSRTTHT